MELLVIGLILWFGGRWLVRAGGPMPHWCRGCDRKYYGSACPRCCEHGSDRPNCEQCFLEGKRISVDVVQGEYEAPNSYSEPLDEELFFNAQ